MNAKTTVRVAALTSLLAFAAMAPDNTMPISGTNTLGGSTESLIPSAMNSTSTALDSSPTDASPVAGGSLVGAFLHKLGQYAEMESGATALAFTPNSPRHELFASTR